MANYGVTPEGFVRPRQNDIKTEMEDQYKSVFGRNINLQSSSIFAQIIGIHSEREAKLWEKMEDVYNSRNPDTAEGVPLDNVGSISGVKRLGALPTKVVGQLLFGTTGSTIDAGKIFSVDGSPTARFKTLAAVTLVAGQDAIQLVEFDLVPASGSFRLTYRGQFTTLLDWDSTAQEIQDALNALDYLSGVVVTGDFTAGFTVNFQGDDGKIVQPLLGFQDNTLEDGSSTDVVISVSEVQEGIIQGSVDCEAETTGPTPVPLYSLTVIETPVTGLDRVLNVTEGVLGRNRETDNAYRLRRVQSLQRAGSSTVEAIRARLFELQDVQEVVVFENVTEVVDGNGLPGKSFRAYVQGGDEQTIGNTVWKNKPAGIQTTGDILVNVTDTQGVVQTVYFSRPVEKGCFVKIKITKDVSSTSLWPVNGDELVRTAISDFINDLEIGQDVIVYPKLISSINGIPGIEDVEIGINTTGSPAYGDDDNIVIAINEKAVVADPVTDIVVEVIP